MSSLLGKTFFTSMWLNYLYILTINVPVILRVGEHQYYSIQLPRSVTSESQTTPFKIRIWLKLGVESTWHAQLGGGTESHASFYWLVLIQSTPSPRCHGESTGEAFVYLLSFPSHFLMENSEPTTSGALEQTELFRSESVALVLVVGYFVLMSSIGVFSWCRVRKRVRDYVEQRRLRRPQRFEHDSRVLKIKYCGGTNCESPG